MVDAAVDRHVSERVRDAIFEAIKSTRKKSEVARYSFYNGVSFKKSDKF